jgi:DNA polymerase-3 subunit epsilon
MNSYLVFDFETSGLDPRRDRIIQVGVCVVRDGSVISTDGWLVDQSVRISAEARAVHGITEKDVQAHGIPPQESLGRLFTLMSQAPACVGHNIHRFDVLFMFSEARRLGVQAPRVEDFVDTAALFKGCRKGPKETDRAYAERVLAMKALGLKYSIPACLKELRIDSRSVKAHNAAGDAYMTHLIYEKLKSLPAGR